MEIPKVRVYEKNVNDGLIFRLPGNVYEAWSEPDKIKMEWKYGDELIIKPVIGDDGEDVEDEEAR